MGDSVPYLSVVVAARNDNHGGNLLHRMQLFVDGLLTQMRRHDMDAELVIVEWNPPADNPKLAEVIRWPPNIPHSRVRIIGVAPALHRRSRNSEKIPLFQFIAKNVGIRRARGDFVLATNLDILFSDDLIRRIANRELLPDSYYRIDRHDVPPDVPSDRPIDDRLEYCENHVVRVFQRDGTYTYPTRTFYRIYPRLGGRAGVLLLVLERMGAELREGRMAVGRYRERWRLGVYARGVRRMIEFARTPQRERLHTNASGDFTLMARDRWWALRGYPEWPLHGLHIDSVLCYMARHLPLREVVFDDPSRIYHIGHLHGWTPELDAMMAFEARLEQQGVPYLSHQELNELAVKMLRQSRPIVVNEENWGLGDLDFDEEVIN